MKLQKQIENKKIKADPREYLGISQIGESCKRSLWYTFRFASKFEIFSPRQIRLFSRGHREEPIITNDLKKIGVKVHSTQKKCSFAFGHGSGHYDGELSNLPGFPKKLRFLFEAKTSKTSAFNSIKISVNNGIDHNAILEKKKIEHFVQCQLYMLKFDLKNCLYIMVCKENDDRIYLHIKLNKKFATSEIEKATQIIFLKTPPEKIGDRDFYRCRPFQCKVEDVEKLFCQHREICHNDKPYQKTCRTCRFVEMCKKGKWQCSKKKKLLPLKSQLKACKKYQTLV